MPTEPRPVGDPGETTDLGGGTGDGAVGPSSPSVTTGLPELQVGPGAVETTAHAVEWVERGGVAAIRRLGRYTIEGQIGKGGFGQVFLGRDDELERPVAIKLADRLIADDADITEARIAAGLDHPHVVPVFDVGRTVEGRLFIVSKLIDGWDLAARLRQRRLTLDQAADLVRKIASALHHAHESGLVHRDVKPGNILLDKSGRPYICDFGLALREEDWGKGSGSAGTPTYMSPEQARGEGHRVDRRSDIYSLGVVLYELITGRVPFAGNILELLDRIQHQEAAPPRESNPSLPAELERICLKCLSKRASDRYCTSEALAADLEAFRDGGERGPKSGPEFKVVPRGLRAFDADDADFYLELLAGPRNARGLPESVAFWLAHLEETDAARTFPVGLLYGPSGCGKSSLVRAALLPRLGDHIRTVYVEATPDDTEAHLLRALRRACPEVAGEPGLVETLTRLRRRGTRKVVLVVDQFEQWLHARDEFAGTGLVDALRQCDGGNLQALLLVRDDFWLAVSRFLRELEVPLVEGQNSGLIDLFDRMHARRVLAEFGRAYGRLPENPTQFEPEQQRFLDDAVSGLAQGGKVVPVRLALFTEMVKAKPWTPKTLRATGGARGVGVTFLEENIGADDAPAGRRLHQKAARAVLRALLPDDGTEIKGNVRPQDELLDASGYARRPDLFRDLLRILDGELRLITPADRRGLDPTPAAEGTAAVTAQPSYQLTHDFLVPALRDWLTRKQRETPAGRAELRLDERSASWNAKPEGRRLPTWREFLAIRRLTDQRRWTEPQRAMMREASRHHARALVRRLLHGNLADVPGIVRRIDLHRTRTEPLIRREHDRADAGGKARLHTTLALLPSDLGLLDDVYDRLVRARPDEFPVLRDALAPYRRAMSDRLWADAESTTDDARALRTASALASYDPDNPRWELIRENVTRVLTGVVPESLGIWKDALRPVRRALIPALTRIFRDHGLGELRLSLATSTLADYAADDAPLLADLVNDADPRQFAALFPVLALHPATALAELGRELDRTIESSWPECATGEIEGPADEARRSIEGAGGFVSSSFAFAPGLRREGLTEILGRMGEPGYRPLSIRPHRAAQGGAVAVVWTRDARRWRWAECAGTESLSRADLDARAEGLLPLDVAFDEPDDGPEPLLVAVWAEADEAVTDSRLVFGLVDESRPEVEGLVARGFNCEKACVTSRGRGPESGASVWTRRADRSRTTTRAYCGHAGLFREDACPGLVLSDVRLTADGDEADTIATALWNISTQYECRFLECAVPTEHARLALAIAEDGFRPTTVSVAPTRLVSVWVRPLVDEGRKERLARRQANAAVALLRLEDGRRTWPLLEFRPDPRLRSNLIHRLSRLDTDPRELIARLGPETEVSARRAVLLALGEFDDRQLPPAERERLTPMLLEMYRVDPDPGIHGATFWLLRRWGHQAEIGRIDRQGPVGRIDGDRRWFLSGEYQTFSVVEAPGEVVIGSPPTEEGREGGIEGDAEAQYHARIDRPFALMNRAVTVAEFLLFRAGFHYRKLYSPGPDCPINNLSWYDSAAYCNWLNEREGIPIDQWCYRPNARGEYAEGMTIVPDFLDRSGYRLPTEAEWEYACRAGATTSRFFGESPDLETSYVWGVKNSLGVAFCPAGTVKPNDLGLFDMVGNIVEWSHDEYVDRSSGGDLSSEGRELADASLRVMRGGPLNAPSRSLRSAFAIVNSPNTAVYAWGLRPARTLIRAGCVGGGGVVSNTQNRIIRGSSIAHPLRLNRCGYSSSIKVNTRMYPLGLRVARGLGP